MSTTTATKIVCAHCGDPCAPDPVRLGDKPFCCEGCRAVYQLLDRSGLCDYYRLNEQPGVSRSDAGQGEKFAFLDDDAIAAPFIIFRDGEETHARFYLPQVHCSSCLYLLENLHRLDPAVITSRIDFSAKEVTVVFDHNRISLRRLADLLASTGYEPYISLRDLGGARPAASRGMIYRLGIAGFCFANIMLLSFPEYLGLEGSEPYLRSWFRTLNLALSLPVFIYSAQPFYRAAWKGLRHKFLNIDAPIVLAIFVTFLRSLYEVLSATGAGYFDSMTGIVFFMLAGRMLQDRTHRRLAFEREYTSYFPIAVTVLADGKEIPRTLPEIRCGDTLRIQHGELIPADGILTRGLALIDYSFVTGESLPVPKEPGELLYAGGRQTGASLEVLVVKEVAQSYLTQLWNRQEDKQEEPSAIHRLSRRFTYIVLTIAAVAGIYWWAHDPSRIGGAVTAVLIVACPCALLLSSTFTNGNILRILGNNGFYLRNARVIERIAGATHIVFDKTGTLTQVGGQEPAYEGISLTVRQEGAVATLAAQSTHPLSRSLARYLGRQPSRPVEAFSEVTGKGVQGWIDGDRVAIGSYSYVMGVLRGDGSRKAFLLPSPEDQGAGVYIAWNDALPGCYRFLSTYREGIPELIEELKSRYHLSLLSGDNAGERGRLERLMGKEARLFFNQSPEEKAAYIRQLQEQGEKVIMIGDGLNDAGALRQSEIGVAVAASSGGFTPASQAILDAGQLCRLPRFTRFCRMANRIIVASFILSILYNVIGLSFAVQSRLSPLIAAILMPASSLSILLLTYGAGNWAARRLGLVVSSQNE